ncbi:MAG: DUF4340 domain-containing protein [Bacteroidales bacterium]|nr:DUF4340 domain-containing protein [Bacteroidales bacterium]MBK7628804.1 DUF4340 domain-containing protein [Bacteroidales bacterium]
MSKRFDNKKLIYVLGILVVILLFTFVFKVPKDNATLKGSLVDLDTTAVTKIILYPKTSTGEPFEFVKEKDRWTVRQGNIISNPASGSVQNIFNDIISIKPQSLAAVDEARWKEFELTDSLAVRVKFLNSKGKKLTDILIGKLTYKQVANPYGYSGGNNIEGTSYVRVYGEKEVYAVDGFLSFTFNGKFSDWRDKTIFRCRKEDILNVKFVFPGDSSYTLTKKDAGWFAGNEKADSTTVSNFLNSLANLNGQEFADGFKPVSNPDYQIIIEGNNLLNSSVRCYRNGAGENYVLVSSLNPESNFSSNRNGLFSQIIKDKNYFIK